MVVCKIPNSDESLDQIVNCLKILSDLENEFNKNDESTLDMSSLEWICPFSSLILSSKISELHNLRKNSLNIIPPSKQVVTEHLDRIGFPLGDSNINGTHLPIRHFNKYPSKTCNKLFDFIDETFPHSLQGNCVKFLLSELVDNVDQHSEYTHGTIMAQFFPKKEIVDIGVIDNGISIPALFEKNNISFKEDAKAIESAMCGKSTKKEEGRGFGLSSTNAIITEGLKGQCYMISRKGMLTTAPKNIRKVFIFEDVIHKGTIIYLRFPVPKERVNILPYIQK